MVQSIDCPTDPTDRNTGESLAWVNSPFGLLRSFACRAGHGHPGSGCHGTTKEFEDLSGEPRIDGSGRSIQSRPENLNAQADRNYDAADIIFEVGNAV